MHVHRNVFFYGRYIIEIMQKLGHIRVVRIEFANDLCASYTTLGCSTCMGPKVHYLEKKNVMGVC